MSDTFVEEDNTSIDDQQINDDSFLDAAAKDAGYNEDAIPGGRGSIPPEGPYKFRFEFPKIDDETKRWPIKTTKKGDKFTGTSIKAQLLGVVGKSPLSLEEFDAQGLAARTFSVYISSLFMYGRSSMTDFINCVHSEKFPADRSIREAKLMIEELMQGLPEGTATVKWVPFFKNGEDKWERLADLLEKVQAGSGKKYKGGAKNFPKDAETGEPATHWEHSIGEGETVDVIVMPELDLFLPFEQESE